MVIVSDLTCDNFSIGWSGAIPANIGNLANLTVFTAPSSQLSGTLPSSFSLLTELETLTLTGNSLSGQVPAALCENDADIQVDCTVSCSCCTNYQCR